MRCIGHRLTIGMRKNKQAASFACARLYANNAHAVLVLLGPGGGKIRIQNKTIWFARNAFYPAAQAPKVMSDVLLQGVLTLSRLG